MVGFIFVKAVMISVGMVLGGGIRFNFKGFTWSKETGFAISLLRRGMKLPKAASSSRMTFRRKHLQRKVGSRQCVVDLAPGFIIS